MITERTLMEVIHKHAKQFSTVSLSKNSRMLSVSFYNSILSAFTFSFSLSEGGNRIHLTQEGALNSQQHTAVLLNSNSDSFRTVPRSL